MNILEFKRKKIQNEAIRMLTCYDYPSARIVSESDIDCVLVGDSVAMAVHGHASTITATMEMMILHTRAVAKGIGKQMLISDLPFLSHRISRSDTIKNVKALFQAGAHAVKIEGSDPELCKTIAYLVTAGLPVMGHIGLMPQAIHQQGGYKVQGKQDHQAELLLQQAKTLEAAGCFAIVIECVPHQLAAAITAALTIPTIGIGAGYNTDGQILVWHDLLGLQADFKPKFIKHFTNGKEMLLAAINHYASEVRDRQFPSPEHIY